MELRSVILRYGITYKMGFKLNKDCNQNLEGNKKKIENKFLIITSWSKLKQNFRCNKPT